jgi:hypothetical protein
MGVLLPCIYCSPADSKKTSRHSTDCCAQIALQWHAVGHCQSSDMARLHTVVAVAAAALLRRSCMCGRVCSRTVVAVAAAALSRRSCVRPAGARIMPIAHSRGGRMWHADRGVLLRRLAWLASRWRALWAPWVVASQCAGMHTAAGHSHAPIGHGAECRPVGTVVGRRGGPLCSSLGPRAIAVSRLA